MPDEEGSRLLVTTAEVVAAYVRKNRVRPQELAALLEEVSATFARLGSGPGLDSVGRGPDAARKPAVPVKRSVTPDFIISLEDGRKFRSLRRHLMAAYGMTPQDYRARWNLPPDYPMVAPNYATERSRIATRARAEQLGKQGPKKTDEE